METGTTSMVPDSRVMQALENLSESQVNDFLTGRAPLLLAMKLGEHMMFVQLQLSASSCSTRRRSLHGQPPSHCSSHASSTTQKENVKCFCNHPPQCGVPGGHTAAEACGVPAGHTSGAVIDSVNQIGQGIYSGTFSGTLDPTIQDSRGKPKRDINTILQILNDLLVASPQFQQSQAMHMHHVNHSENKMSSNSQTCLGKTLSQSPLEANEDSLRGKVQSLQKMMHERKLRRQEKRGLRAPYQWSDRRSSFNRRVSQSSHAKFDSQSGRDREVASKQTENITSAETPYSTTSTTTTMEHESVLV